MINWQQFGLRSNPYDTLPLIEGGDLPIEKAFVGRNSELKTLKDIHLSDSRSCLVISGNVGVGKTSLANFHKFLFKYQEEKKPLFSFRREIEASQYILNKYNFIIEIISSVLREIKLIDPKLIQSYELLSKLEKIVDVTQTLGISGGWSIGIGHVDVNESNTILPPNIPLTTLEGYFKDLIKFIITQPIREKKYKGLIVHVNNFDILLSDKKAMKQIHQFFQENRDFLQTKDVYFLFLGPQEMYRKIIAKEKRLKSIFYLAPLVINPLSKSEVVKAFDERMELLKSEGILQYISPFSSEVIYKLYDLYQGDIRSIMTGLKDILAQVPETVLEPLGVNEALFLLGKERWEQALNTGLTSEKIEVLKILAMSDEMITQRDLAKKLDKSPSNMSGYYFNPLKEAGIIEVKKQQKKLKFWGLTQDYTPIRYILENKKIIQQKVDQESRQLNLF